MRSQVTRAPLLPQSRVQLFDGNERNGRTKNACRRGKISTTCPPEGFERARKASNDATLDEVYPPPFSGCWQLFSLSVDEVVIDRSWLWTYRVGVRQWQCACSVRIGPHLTLAPTTRSALSSRFAVHIAVRRKTLDDQFSQRNLLGIHVTF